MENLQGNRFDQIGLQHFAETPAEGPIEEPAGGPESREAAVADAVVEPEQPAFFEYDKPGGEKMSFKDADELKQAFGKSFMMQRDYTGKTTALREQSEKVKVREAELEKQAEDLKGVGKEYGKFRNFMNARPDTYAKFKRMVESPPSPEEAFGRSKGYVDEQLTEIRGMFDEMKKYRADQEFDTQKKELYAKMKGKYSDFDSDAVERVLGSLSDNPEALVEMGYFSERGRLDPVEMERRVAEASERKRRETPGVVPGPGKPGKAKSFDNIADARRAAQEAQ